MIFVTVGTDHHPFDRLIKTVDELKSQGVISEDVFIQTGSSVYLPDHCYLGNSMARLLMTTRWISPKGFRNRI
jgi:UDP-N-acetylglucosamine transferase subunit ALG13